MKKHNLSSKEQAFVTAMSMEKTKKFGSWKAGGKKNKNNLDKNHCVRKD